MRGNARSRHGYSRGGFDVATSLSVIELARAIERATDRLAGFGHLLRRHIMTDLSA